MEINDLLEKLPVGTKIIKRKDGWWYATSIWNKETKKYTYSNFSSDLYVTLDRLLRKIENDIKIGDGFKDTKKWL